MNNFVSDSFFFLFSGAEEKQLPGYFDRIRRGILRYGKRDSLDEEIFKRIFRYGKRADDAFERQDRNAHIPFRFGEKEE